MKFFKFLISLLLVGVICTTAVYYVGTELKDNPWAREFFSFFHRNSSTYDSDIIDRYVIDENLNLLENVKQNFQFLNNDRFDVNASDKDVISVDDVGDVIRNKLIDYGYSSDDVQRFLDENLPSIVGYSKYVSIVFDDFTNMMNRSKNQIAFYVIRRNDNIK